MDTTTIVALCELAYPCGKQLSFWRNLKPNSLVSDYQMLLYFQCAWAGWSGCCVSTVVACTNLNCTEIFSPSRCCFIISLQRAAFNDAQAPSTTTSKQVRKRKRGKDYLPGPEMGQYHRKYTHQWGKYQSQALSQFCEMNTACVHRIADTYVMKLFDRSVDLAQFTEDAPLYPICRAWMRNQPHSRGTDTATDADADNYDEVWIGAAAARFSQKPSWSLSTEDRDTQIIVGRVKRKDGLSEIWKVEIRMGVLSRLWNLGLQRSRLATGLPFT